MSVTRYEKSQSLNGSYLMQTWEDGLPSSASPSTDPEPANPIPRQGIEGETGDLSRGRNNPSRGLPVLSQRETPNIAILRKRRNPRSGFPTIYRIERTSPTSSSFQDLHGHHNYDEHRADAAIDENIFDRDSQRTVRIHAYGGQSGDRVG